MKKSLYVFIFCFCFSLNALNEDPVVFLENILMEIKPSLMSRNDIYLEESMEKYLDFNEISLWIVGKKIWLSSLDIEKTEFINVLKLLMLKTYKKTVYYYIDSEIDFLKPKLDTNLVQKRIQMFSVMKKNNKSITISYRLIKNDNSWLVFDIVIEGVSILKSLQTQYSDMIKFKGLNYASIKMKEKLAYD